MDFVSLLLSEYLKSLMVMIQKCSFNTSPTAHVLKLRVKKSLT